ncbi:NAD(P)-binding domain-containing protein [Amycolatopsis suaedae]|uniref:Pyrroline-5-carboxylate reductase n=1 Tax=Amycolatopsis suaedae TaxID=2510978 RepID=A0A4Q7JER2_9PSEU|nr:NAD(P)-binding domain-containing protein [Amycolatopsis suaedae]RZQ66019.1 pyrroline-5-carboxylate reductase [Amycolatopsis suaedae]
MYGFIGTGEITAAIVTGLSAGTAPDVFLSPRGREVSRELGARFPNVHVCASNQEVLDNATSVVIAVRPPIGQAVLEELTFRPEHVVISALAGVRVDQLRAWTAPAGRVVRSIPLPSAARGQSLTAMFPDDPAARELYERVGGVVVPREEETLEAFSAATSTFAAHLDYLATIADWLAERGAGAEAASAYVTHVFGQLGILVSQQTDTLAALTGKHMTPGGINEQFLARLREAGVPDTVRSGLDGILSRLRS